MAEAPEQESTMIAGQALGVPPSGGPASEPADSPRLSEAMAGAGTGFRH